MTLSRFVDEYAPQTMPGYPCISIPRWSTQITTVASGDEQANQRWAHPLQTFVLPQAVRKFADYAAVAAHWYAMRGPFHTWPFRDPLDFASVTLAQPNVVPTISGYDQIIATGDGETTEFQLTKTYARGNQSYARPIFLPLDGFVILSIDDGAEFPALTPTRPGGVVTLSDPLPEGSVLKAGFYFDVEVRFESDDTFSGIVRDWQVGGYADITLQEVRRCSETA